MVNNTGLILLPDPYYPHIGGDHKSMDDGDTWDVAFSTIFVMEENEILPANVRRDDDGKDDPLDHIEYDRYSDDLEHQWINKGDFNILVSFKIVNRVLSSTQTDDPFSENSKGTTETPINIISVITTLLGSIIFIKKNYQ